MKTMVMFRKVITRFNHGSAGFNNLIVNSVYDIIIQSDGLILQ